MKFLGLSAVVALVIASSAADAQNREPIRIGVSLAASGPVGQVGAPALKGIQMAAEEINNKGGILGRKIELITRDTKGSADEAVRVSRELILKENMDFLLGGTTSAEAPAVSTIAKENKIVFFAVIAGLDALTSPANLPIDIFSASERPITRKVAPPPKLWRNGL